MFRFQKLIFYEIAINLSFGSKHMHKAWIELFFSMEFQDVNRHKLGDPFIHLLYILQSIFSIPCLNRRWQNRQAHDTLCYSHHVIKKIACKLTNGKPMFFCKQGGHEITFEKNTSYFADRSLSKLDKKFPSDVQDMGGSSSYVASYGSTVPYKQRGWRSKVKLFLKLIFCYLMM